MSSDEGTQQHTAIQPASLNGGAPKEGESPQDPAATREYTPDFAADEPEAESNLTLVAPQVGAEAPTGTPEMPEPVPVKLGDREQEEGPMTDDRDKPEGEEPSGDRDVVRSVMHPKAIFAELNHSTALVMVCMWLSSCFVMSMLIASTTLLIALDKVIVGSASFYVLLLVLLGLAILVSTAHKHILERK